VFNSNEAIPHIVRNKKVPLDRFLPPIPDEYVTKYLKTLPLKENLILDPFGASPKTILRVAQFGGRVLVAVNNPILQLLIEVAAKQPDRIQTRTSLASLAALRVRDERIELHIQNLYKTTCPKCLREIYAEAFLWERHSKVPYARILNCESCKTTGEFPLTPADLQHAAQFGEGGLHHARALGRVAPPNDPDRIHVEEALNVYPPRAVYALITLVNKLDFLDNSSEQDKVLMAMLLNAFDQANTLWPHPVARERPKQLTIPPTFRENNLWLALEESVDLWETDEEPVPITYWPELPPEDGGICLFKGRIRELADKTKMVDFGLVITTFPRPNQAFWALSALWSGWLWGYEAVEHFKPVLRRRRYDWSWHSTATQAAIHSTIPTLKKNAKFIGLIGEAEPGFASAVTIAAEKSGLRLVDIDYFSEKKLIKLCWENAQNDEISSIPPDKKSNSIQNAGREYLLAKGEPSDYMQLHIAILSNLVRRNSLCAEEKPAECYSKLHQEFLETLNYQNGFLRFGGSEKSIEVGQWWLVNDHDATLPLSDRVEMAVVQFMQSNPNYPLTDVKHALMQQERTTFSGLFIPELSLINECLESYGEIKESGWQFRAEDTPSLRREEIKSMSELVNELGNKLGFKVNSESEGIPKSIWLDDIDTPQYILYISASALLGKFLWEVNSTPAHRIVLLPGGRANLVMFKLNRDPRLKIFFENGWSFLKYRHARQLANSPSLTAISLESQLQFDPLTYSETQLRMF